MSPIVEELKDRLRFSYIVLREAKEELSAAKKEAEIAELRCLLKIKYQHRLANLWRVIFSRRRHEEKEAGFAKTILGMLDQEVLEEVEKLQAEVESKRFELRKVKRETRKKVSSLEAELRRMEKRNKELEEKRRSYSDIDASYISGENQVSEDRSGDSSATRRSLKSELSVGSSSATKNCLCSSTDSKFLYR